MRKASIALRIRRFTLPEVIWPLNENSRRFALAAVLLSKIEPFRGYLPAASPTRGNRRQRG
jgi:hypothetical protein